jgi:NAD(P)-dependent dehydrogenase (short-subunit alcohol dehydrogenase family)
MTYPFSVHSDEFKDKRVLLTGGTKGMGAAMVERFRISGARIATTARSEPAGFKQDVLFIKADISTLAGTNAVAERINREWGGLDILVNNVGGTAAKRGGFEVVTDEDWRTILDVNPARSGASGSRLPIGHAGARLRRLLARCVLGRRHAGRNGPSIDQHIAGAAGAVAAAVMCAGQSQIVAQQAEQGRARRRLDQPCRAVDI